MLCVKRGEKKRKEKKGVKYTSNTAAPHTWLPGQHLLTHHYIVSITARIHYPNNLHAAGGLWWSLCTDEWHKVQLRYDGLPVSYSICTMCTSAVSMSDKKAKESSYRIGVCLSGVKQDHTATFEALYGTPMCDDPRKPQRQRLDSVDN